MRERRECLEAQHLAPRSPRRDADPSEKEIGCRQGGKRAEDHDRAAPIGRHFAEVIPPPSAGLYEHPRPRVELGDVALAPRMLAKQGLLIYHARARVFDRALWGLRRRRPSV